MEDLAREVVTMLKIDDRVSDLELRAQGIDFAQATPHFKPLCEILKVKTELFHGRLHFVVEHLATGSYETNEDGVTVLTTEWQKLSFDKDDWEGVAGFVDGFMGHGHRSNTIQLCSRRPDGRSVPICMWTLDRNSQDDKTRAFRFRSIVKALLGQTQQS
jgi:hypothetical protein